MMPKSDTLEKIRTDTKEIFKPEEPAKYDVIFLNDDITPMEFVIRILKQIFNKTQEEAVQITKYVHENGKGVAGTYIYEVAEQKGIETTLLAREQKYPLQVKVQKQK